jgi:hypothetical protein
MSSDTIQRIVDAYVKLGDARALESLRDHREGLLNLLKLRSGFDFGLVMEQFEHELRSIEQGLERLAGFNRQGGGEESA